MYNNSIEDIIIDKNFNQKKKSKKPIFVFLLILILLISAGIAYYSYINNKTKNKEKFLQGLSNTNISFFTNNEVYNQIFQKISTSNYEMNNDLTFSTTMENENIESMGDLSKYLLNWKVVNNIEDEENYGEFNLSYSDNKIINIKTINNKNQFAIVSDEIVNKYVGINKENADIVFEKLGINLDRSQYTNLTNDLEKNNIEIDDTTKQEKMTEYFNFVIDKLNDEKFTSQENQISLVKENSEEVLVNAYKLSLTQEEYVALIKEVLTKLKDDTQLLEQFIIDSSNAEESENEIVTEPENEITNIPATDIDAESTNDIEDSNVNETTSEPTIQTNMNIVTIQTLEPVGTSLETSEVTEQSDTISEIPMQINEESQEVQDENSLEMYSTEENEIDLYTALEEDLAAEANKAEKYDKMLEIFKNIILGKKTDTTLEELQEIIDYLINNINEEGNGLEITVYMSELATEKISVIFPDETTIDLEFNSESETNKDLIITYLYKETASNVNMEDNIETYSATENAISEDVVIPEENKISGFKFKISKSQNDASTTMNLIFNKIENKEIAAKVSLDLTTKGTSSSKNINNEGIIIYSNNDGELKVNIKNQINFDKISEIEKLTDENCLLLDTLSDEELTLTIAAITTKIQEVYKSKIENLSFIDTNTQAPGVTVNREELRNLLITTISMQMGEALARGEQFILQNIEGLQIDGHIVTVTIENDVAEVSVDGVKFRIDSNFNLSDVQ